MVTDAVHQLNDAAWFSGVSAPSRGEDLDTPRVDERFDARTRLAQCGEVRFDGFVDSGHAHHCTRRAVRVA